MVLFITGECDTDCFYCPISPKKKGKDVMYANEREIFNFDEMIEEAKAMDATGTGITGGDPLLVMDRTLEAIRILKKTFGKWHHIHLYTSIIDLDRSKALCDAGLDEIRFHPPMSQWETMDMSEISKIMSETTLHVGLEVPAIPGNKDKLEALLKKAKDIGIEFININEFEFSESNWNMMEGMGFKVKNDLSSAVAGSEEMALELMRKHPKYPIHFCSSAFKDGVQLRNRLIRRAHVISKDYEYVTDDGTLLKGAIFGEDLDDIVSALKKLKVPDNLFFVDRDKKRVEIALWKLKKISKKLPYESYMVEEYPTYDRMEVERMPMKHKKK